MLKAKGAPVSLLLGGMLLGGPAAGANEHAIIRKVAVYADGSAQVYVNGDSSFDNCSGGVGRVHLGKPWRPAPAAMLTVALRARDRAQTVTLDLLMSTQTARDGKRYCYANMIRDPA